MSYTPNYFLNQLAVQGVIPPMDLYEQRIENDVDGNPLFVGISITPNASTSELIWYIRKIEYDGNGYVNRVQLPSDGYAFRYAWDDREDYFS